MGEMQERDEAAIDVAENDGDDDDEHQWESPIPFQLVYSGSPLLMQEDDIFKFTDRIYRQMIFRFSNHYPHTPEGFNKLKNDLVAAAKPSGVQLISGGSSRSGADLGFIGSTRSKTKMIMCDCSIKHRKRKPVPGKKTRIRVSKRPGADAKVCPFRLPVIYQDQYGYFFKGGTGKRFHRYHERKEFCVETATWTTEGKPAKLSKKPRDLAPGQQARIQAKLNEWFAVVGNDTTEVEVKEMEDFLDERIQAVKDTREEKRTKRQKLSANDKGPSK